MLRETLIKLLNNEPDNTFYCKNFLEKYRGRVKKFLDGKLFLPVEAEIQPSSSCNAKCKHCFSKITIPNALRDTLKIKDNLVKVINKIIDSEVDGEKVESFKFSGTSGDPLCNFRIIDVINRIKENRRFVKLFTNGIGLSYKSLGKSYAELICSVNQLRVSLDAAKWQTWGKIKRVRNPRENFENILRMIKLIIKNNSEIDVQIGFVISQDNYLEVGEACNLFKDIGVKSIFFREDFTKRLNYLERKEYSKKIEEIIPNKKFKIILVKPKNLLIDSCCFVPFFWITVGPDGCLYPCGHRAGDFGWNMGNLLEQDLVKLLANQRKNKFPNKECVICPPFSHKLNPLFDCLYQNKNNPQITKILEEISNTPSQFLVQSRQAQACS